VKVRGHRVEVGEVEAAVGSMPGVRHAVVVAAGAAGAQQLVAYVTGEVTGARVRAWLEARLPRYLVPATVMVVERLPLTANGKVDRRALPAPRTALEARLAAVWAAVLRRPTVGVEDNFFELGGDSILSLQIVGRAQAAGIAVTVRDVFAHQTVAALAAAVARGTPSLTPVPQAPVEGAVPLTPIQQWFFAQRLPARHHWNQAVLVELEAGTDPAWVEASLQAVVAQHDALRLRFRPEGATWTQAHAVPGAARWTVHDLRGESVSAQVAAQAAVMAAAQASLDLTQGPLVHGVYVRRSETRDRLLLVVHHAVIDGVSWRVLLEDLQTGVAQQRLGFPVRLPAKTTSFQAWASALTEYAQTPAVAEERAYWTAVTSGPSGPVPRDGATGANVGATQATVTVALGTAATMALLQRVPQGDGPQLEDALVAAVVAGLGTWTGTWTWRLDLEGHGREPWTASLDVSRTVGWFTTLYPVWVASTATASARTRAEAVRALRVARPQHGLGYGLLRYLATPPLPPPATEAEISINYLGQFDQVSPTRWPRAPESPGPPRAPADPRPHLLEVTAAVRDGILQIHIAYSEAIHRRATIEAFAATIHTALEQLLTDTLAAPDVDEPTGPSFVKTDADWANVLAELNTRPS
jgi:non-ribosomal peptide synthase protein (TIGR01720 family)